MAHGANSPHIHTHTQENSASSHARVGLHVNDSQRSAWHPPGPDSCQVSPDLNPSCRCLGPWSVSIQQSSCSRCLRPDACAHPGLDTQPPCKKAKPSFLWLVSGFLQIWGRLGQRHCKALQSVSRHFLQICWRTVLGTSTNVMTYVQGALCGVIQVTYRPPTVAQ